MKPRVLRNWIWLVPLAALLWACLLSPLWAQPAAEPSVVCSALQNGEGWTDPPYPPPTGKMIYIDQDGGGDGNDGLDPHGFALSDASYDHTGHASGERILTAGSGTPFASYTDNGGGDRTDVIYLYAGASGSPGVAAGWYVIENKISSTELQLAAAAGLTGDDTSIASSSGPKSTLAAGVALMTTGAASDQLLCQRGDTWTDEQIGLGLSGAALTGTAANPVLIGVYGPLSDGRAVIRQDDSTNQKAIIKSSGSFNYLVVQGFECQPNNKSISAFNSGVAFTTSAVSSHLLIEDCYVHESGTNILIQGDSGYDIPSVTIRRCVSTDSWSNGDHSQGLFTKYVDGLVIEDCIFDKNGWVQSGTVQSSGFNHSMYISDGTKNVLIRRVVSSRASLLGVKLELFDTTGRVYEVCFSKNRFAGQLGVGDEGGARGTSVGNYLYFYNCCADGYHNGYHLNNIAGGYFRNVIMGPRGFLSGIPGASPPNDEYDKSQYTVQLTEGNNPGVGFNDFTIDELLFYDSRGPLNMSELGAGTYGQWSNVVVTNFESLQPDTDKAFVQVDTGLDYTFSGSNYYSVNTSDPANRFDVDGTKLVFFHATNPCWQTDYEPTATNVNTPHANPGRTCEDYATDTVGNGGLGLANYEALVSLWKLEGRHNWNPEYHAEQINDYIRDGVGMAEYSPTPDVTAPQFVSAELTGANVLTVEFDEWVDATDETGFSLVASGGAATLTMTDFSGTSLAFTTSRTIYSSETLTLSYDSGTGDVADAADNALGDLTSESVTNSGSESPSATPGNSIIPGIYVR